MSRRKNREINVFSTSAIDLFASALGVFIILVMVLFPYFGKRYKLTPQPVAPVKKNVSPEKLIEEITELRQLSASLKTDLEKSESVIETMTSEIKEQQSNASVMEAEITRLKELTKPINVVNAPMPEINDTEQLQAKVTELQQQVTVTENAKQALQEKVKSLQQQMQQQQAKSPEEGEKSSNFMAVIIQWPSLKHDVDLEVQSPSGKKYNFKKRSYKGNPAQFTLDSRTGPGSEVWQTSELEEGTYKVRYNFYNHYGNTENAAVDARIFTKKGAFKVPTKTLEFPKKRRYEFQFTVNEDGAVKTQL